MGKILIIEEGDILVIGNVSNPVDVNVEFLEELRRTTGARKILLTRGSAEFSKLSTDELRSAFGETCGNISPSVGIGNTQTCSRLPHGPETSHRSDDGMEWWITGDEGLQASQRPPRTLQSRSLNTVGDTIDAIKDNY